MIDEAAAIPLPLVKELLGPYLVFMSSTINGSERLVVVVVVVVVVVGLLVVNGCDDDDDGGVGVVV